jgi:hypothetical protein
MDAFVITFGSGRLLRYLAIGACDGATKTGWRGATWTKDIGSAEKFSTELRAKTAARTHVPHSDWSVVPLAVRTLEPSVA